ncbi:MAG TPA: tetratricopeptide repeat protein, partial [Bacteroidia bacterium]|nr:tetratricopeptide repeat protein [Bacteroidia bacterium]
MQKILSSNRNTFVFFFILSMLFYGNSIKNGFSLDDSYVTVTNYPIKGKNYIPNNTLISKGFKGIGKIWHSHYGYGNGTAYDYRPLVMSMFAIEYGIFGQAPHINHFINVILYAVVVFCLFLFLKKCLAEYPFKESFALVSSILFLAHPIHTEVVNNIKCRDELLAMVFMLLGSISLLKFFEIKQPKQLVFSIIFMFLALYCKFTAAIIIVLVPLTLFFFSKINKKQLVYVLLGSFFCFLLYRRSRHVLVTEKEVRNFFHFENPLYTEHISFYTKVLFALKVFGTYVKLMFFPYPLRFYYGSSIFTTQVNLFDFEVILGVIFVIAASYYCYKYQNKIAFFGLLFFLLSIAPLVDFLQPVAGVLGERLCFTASIGFILFITSILFSFYKTTPNQIIAPLFFQKPLSYFTIVLVLSLFYIWNRNSAWESEFSLYEHDAQYSEASGGQNNLLGNKYYELLLSGNTKYTQQFLIEKGLKHYNLAIKDDSTLYSAFNNAGVLYFSYLNKFDIALNYFQRGIINNPNPYPQAYENLGNCYKKKGDFIQAFKNYRIATMQNPKQYKAYTELMNILIGSKRLTPA